MSDEIDVINVDFDPDLDPNSGIYESDGTFTITLDNQSYINIDGTDLSGGYGTINWTNFDARYKSIDLELLDKYPTAKHLYTEFISVYNMCEAEEELNGDNNDVSF